MALESPLLVGADVNRSGRTWSSVASRVLLLAYAAIVTVLMVYAIAKGPQRRAALGLENTQRIAEEDQAFCQELGKEAGSAGFAACANRLGEIRARHAERILGDLSPTL